jgi:menaquinol-cytochrome c reductase cytochrome b/c subunit
MTIDKDYKAEGSADAKKTPKRIAFIKKDTRARVHQEDEEMAMTVPNLVVREVIAFEVMVIVLALLSLFFNAPLEWIANPDHTPNPAKAPWYFLGLQELLHYFPPIVAGVILPGLVVMALVIIPYFKINVNREGLWRENRSFKFVTLVAVVGVLSLILLLFKVYVMLVPTLIVTACALLPYFSRRESGAIGWLANRSVAWWVMTWFVVIVVILTAVGTLFRGPEWSWTWPWNEIY